MALTDGALELGREEMPAYWRLFGWIRAPVVGPAAQAAG